MAPRRPVPSNDCDCQHSAAGTKTARKNTSHRAGQTQELPPPRYPYPKEVKQAIEQHKEAARLARQASDDAMARALYYQEQIDKLTRMSEQGQDCVLGYQAPASRLKNVKDVKVTRMSEQGPDCVIGYQDHTSRLKDVKDVKMKFRESMREKALEQKLELRKRAGGISARLRKEAQQTAEKLRREYEERERRERERRERLEDCQEAPEDSEVETKSESEED